MSDEYYVRRASRRSRIARLVGAGALLVLLALLGVRSLLHDSCTQSFDRSPQAVIRAYADAVGRGDVPAVQGCWEHFAYFELEAGCSEICLAKVAGAQFRVIEAAVGEATRTPEGRARLAVAVTVACTDGSATHTGEVLLDSIGSEVPWRHWTIVRSTFGGTVAEPWCRKTP